MKTAVSAAPIIALVCVVAASPAPAVPRDPPGAVDAATTPAVEVARLACHSRRCRHVGGYRWSRPYGYYRPYDYYRPYSDAPNAGTSVGPFGIGIF